MAGKAPPRVLLVEQVRYDGHQRLHQVYQRLWHWAVVEIPADPSEKELQDASRRPLRTGVNSTPRERSHD